MDFDGDVSVKDIVNFYIKINDSSKAKRELTQLSSRDRLAALEIIQHGTASHDFKVAMARHFVFDQEFRIRRKAELMLEDLVPGWVSDPAENILKLLRDAEHKGAAKRDAAVKFLFGIVDANSLRETFVTLLNSRNRSHMEEILAILEKYIDASRDQAELVRIFDASLDILLSDDTDQNIKFHASNLLSVFFKKVAATQLGDTLRRKFIERQVEKSEGVLGYLCSGAASLSPTFLEDLLRPLQEGGSAYQMKVVGYFGYVLEKAEQPGEVDAVLDTYPDYWNQQEPAKEEKVRSICRRIRQALDELWEAGPGPEVRELLVRVKFSEQHDKRALLEQIRGRLDRERPEGQGAEQMRLMLRCFLQPSGEESLKLQAAQLLLFGMKDRDSRTAALEYLQFYVENRQLNYAERGSIATTMERLLGEGGLEPVVEDPARYILFLTAADRFEGEREQRALLEYLKRVLDGEGLANARAEERALQSLVVLATLLPSEALRNAARQLETRIRAGAG